jgi:SAM-dependent methyltransferase
MADEVRQAAGPGRRRLLDWGCGYGHMSYLLRRRGFEVTGLTVPDENNLSDSWQLLAQEQGLDVVVSEDDARLPFEDGSFDVVLSCGVLEHVPDEAASVGEIARVLRPGGLFLVYQLPNWLSITEWVSERLLGVAHDRRYRPGQARRLLADGGLAVRSQRHGSMVPKNLDRLPFLRPLFDHRYRFVARVDAALLRVPVVNWFSGTWEIVAEKPAEAPTRRPAAAPGAPALVEAGSDGAHRR